MHARHGLVFSTTDKMPIPTRIVILGSSGFIGSHLKKHLQASENSWEVLGLSLPEVDLTRKESLFALSKFFDANTAVILCAAVKRQFGDNLESYRQNMAIVENLASLLAEHPVNRLFFMSSAAVYGEETHNLAITETTPVNPTSFYGIAKFMGERLLLKVLSHTKTGLVFLRPPLIYGPNDPGNTYGPAGFCSSALKGDPITLWGDGTELREFVHIDDLCRIIELLIDHPFTGPLNVAIGRQSSFLEIIEILGKSTNLPQVLSRPRSKQKADNAFVPTLIQSLLPDTFSFTPLAKGVEQLMKKSTP